MGQFATLMRYFLLFAQYAPILVKLLPTALQLLDEIKQATKSLPLTPAGNTAAGGIVPPPAPPVLPALPGLPSIPLDQGSKLSQLIHGAAKGGLLQLLMQFKNFKHGQK